MKIIAITSPLPIKEECCLCNLLFARGLEILHLRKPGSTQEGYEQFIRQIEPCYRSRMVIHEHYELARKYALRGIHLKFDEREQQTFYTDLQVSISCHSIEELKAVSPQTAYCFLSPIYDSISKPGYRSRFTVMPDLSEIQVPVIALGGITPERLPECQKAHFHGVAVLGYLWEKPSEVLNRYEDFKSSTKTDSKEKQPTLKVAYSPTFSIQTVNLQYITAPKDGISLASQIESVCRGGIRCVQLRIKEASVTDFLQESIKAQKICRRYDALFIVNDHVEIAKEVDADGVHLGKTDMDPRKAREILGSNKIIGATCNSWEDILLRQQQKVDYIGLGPYAFTTTKSNLNPILGLSGYLQLLEQMQEEQIHIPVFAIGGITENDILPLMATGIQGIALSGVIKNSNDLTRKSAEILQLIHQSIDKLKIQTV